MRSILLLTLLLFSSCLTEKRASHRVAALKSKYPHVLAQFCVTNYPVQTSTSIEYQFLPGDTQYVPGPLIDCDSAGKAAPPVSGVKLVPIKVPCPPSKLIRDTIRIRQVDTIVDTRKVDLLLMDLNDLKVEKKQIEAQFRDAKVILGFIIIAGLVFALIAIPSSRIPKL